MALGLPASIDRYRSATGASRVPGRLSRLEGGVEKRSRSIGLEEANG